ncbi:MAG TPA: TonB-dependent receptor [Caulobacteraceae bacterium]|nr:TonB-dependent receptor [Caulobacteraceae bacterium]
MIEVTRRAARSVLLATAGSAALLAAAQAAHADTAAADTTAAGPTTSVGEVVVTAQRRSQNIQDVPESVQAVSSKQLLAAGIKSTQDLGQITPNVTIISPIGAGNQPLITIRGIGLNDFDTNNAGPNGVYVDDVYLSAPGVQNFSMFDISQVQVLKGPQGTLYGRNTSGGALLFTSNRPTDYFTVDVHGEYGNYNTLQLEGAVGGPIAPGFDARIAAVVNHSDGYNHNFLTGQAYDNVQNEAVRLQLQYEPNDRLKLYLNSTVGYLNNHPEPYGHIGVFVPGTQNTPAPTLCTPAQAFAGGCVDLFGYGTPPFWQGAYAETKNLTNLAAITQLRADYKAGPITLTSITSWQYDKKFHPEDTDGDPLNLIRATYGVNSNTYTQEFRAAQSETNFNWVAGVYYLHENLKQDQPLSLFFDGDLGGGFGIPPGPGAFDGIAQIVDDKSSQTTDTAAVFAQGDYTWRRFTLTLGGRYTWERKSFIYAQSTQFQMGGDGNYAPPSNFLTFPNAGDPNNSQSASNFTYRIALSYHVTDQTQLYGSIATGFKSGDFNGSFLGSDQATVDFQLKPVKPEEVTAYEVGEKATLFDHRLVLDAAVFYNAYRNEQVFAQVLTTLTLANGQVVPISAQVLGNAPASHTEGAEFQITAVPFEGLTIDLEPAVLRTRMDNGMFPGGFNLTGNELANAPKFTFTAIVNYRWALANGDDINFRWNSNYRSHYWFDATNDKFIQQNAYWLHNLNIDYESSQHWVAGVFVRNVANEKYSLTSSDISSPFGFLEPVEGPPRMFGVELSYHY